MCIFDQHCIKYLPQSVQSFNLPDYKKEELSFFLGRKQKGKWREREYKHSFVFHGLPLLIRGPEGNAARCSLHHGWESFQEQNKFITSPHHCPAPKEQTVFIIKTGLGRDRQEEITLCTHHPGHKQQTDDNSDFADVCTRHDQHHLKFTQYAFWRYALSWLDDTSHTCLRAFIIYLRLRYKQGTNKQTDCRCPSLFFLPTLNFLNSTIFYFVVVQPRECRAYFVVLLFPTSTTMIKKSDSWLRAEKNKH